MTPSEGFYRTFQNILLDINNKKSSLNINELIVAYIRFKKKLTVTKTNYGYFYVTLFDIFTALSDPQLIDLHTKALARILNIFCGRSKNF